MLTDLEYSYRSIGEEGPDKRRPARSAGYFGDLMRLLEGPVLALALG